MMSRLAETLKSAREQARLTLPAISRLTRIDEERVQQLEGGSRPSPDELDAYALAFGVTPHGLTRGDALRSPISRLLFRATENQSWSAVEALTDTDAHRVFGDFLRATWQLAELAELAGDAPPAELPRPGPVPLDERPPYRADALAGWLREQLGLGLKPIASMRAILERLEVPVFFVTPEELDPAIDGASTSDPCPAILVNLVEGPRCWWRTRMTLAHELCHLLVDHRDPKQPRATLSPYAVATGRAGPRPRKRFEFYDGFDLVERRAGAFAACFLAPAEAVQTAVGHIDPTSEEAVSRVGKTFDIGRTTACYRLKHVYRLADATHRAMLARGPGDWRTAIEHPDRGPDDASLRTGILKERALDALARGKIDRVRCHEVLNLRFTEALPEHPGLSEEQRKPLRSTEDTIRGLAQRYIEQNVARDLVATTVEAGRADGWHVSVVREATNGPAGSVIVSYDRVPQHYVASGSP